MKHIPLLVFLSTFATAIFAQADTAKMRTISSSKKEAILAKQNMPIRSKSPAIKIYLQGQISYSAQYDTGIDACGAALSGIASEMLNPGESRSTTYRCTIKYDATQHAYYNLKLGAVGFTENNLQNNSGQTTIPF